MNPLRSLSRKPAALTHALCRGLEALEERQVPAAVAPPPGLVSWWTADNTAADLTGLNNATLLNGTTYAAGKVAQAFSFDGVNDRIDLGDPNSLKFTASMSIEGWIQVNAVSTTNFGAIVFRGDDRGGLDPYDLHVSSGGLLQFGVSSLTGATYIQTPIPFGQLLHVAATLDDATGAMKLYINGAVASQTVTAARPFRDLDPTLQPGIGIGNANANSTYYNVPFNGLIDELSMYDRALTAAEVQGIYSAGSDGKIKASTYIAPDFPSVAEGPAGSTTPVTFTIQRVGNLSGQAVVNWTTADGTATAGSDYIAASGQVVFLDGESQKTVTVTVNGDNSPETNETFQLLVSTTTPGYAVGMGQATIIDDDGGVSVDDGTATEGDGRIGQTMGAFVSQAGNGGLDRSTAMAYGPDGNLYVGSLTTNQVLRYNGVTGAFLGVFIDAGTGLAPDAPFMQGLQFRPDGKLYVLSRNTAEVQRFDAVTGAFLDNFIPAGSGGLLGAKGMTVGPDGNWYVSSGNTNQVLRYSGTTGAFLGVFVAAGSGGLSNPRALTFGPDGNLYVSSSGSNAVLRYSGQTGAFLNAFVAANSGGLTGPAELLFRNGSLYVASQNTSEVLRYDAQTGAFLDKAATAGLGGLLAPIGLLFDANNNLLVGSYGEILRYGPRSLATFTVHLTIPSATPVTVHYATANGTALAGSDYTATNGAVTFAPGQTTRTILVTTLDDALSEPTETFTINLSNPTGATIADGQAVGTILDNDPPAVAGIRVNDGSAQRSRVTSLQVTFSTAVTFASTPGAAFTLTRNFDSAAVGFTATASVMGGVTVVTVNNFAGTAMQFGSLADGRYTLTALANQISAGGINLDGNGDGTAGDNYTFGEAQGLFRFFGDINGDRHVDIADFGFFTGTFNLSTGQTGFLAAFDFNNDGHIDIADFGQFSIRLFTPLP